MRTIGIHTLTFLIAGLPIFVHAQISNPIGPGSLQELLEAIIDIVLLIAVPIIVLAIIYAGFTFVTAGGSEQKLTLAKKVFLWSVIGGTIILGAKIIAVAIKGTVDNINGG